MSEDNLNKASYVLARYCQYKFISMGEETYWVDKRDLSVLDSLGVDYDIIE